MKIGVKLGVCVAMILAGCKGWTPSPNLPQDAMMTTEMTLCVVKNYQEPLLQVMQDCNIPQTLLQDAKDLQGSASAVAAKAAADQKAADSPAK